MQKLEQNALNSECFFPLEISFENVTELLFAEPKSISSHKTYRKVKHHRILLSIG